MYGRIANLPYNQRRRARMDSQAAASKRRRQKLKSSKIPTRRDFGQHAFDLLVAMFIDMKGSALPEGLRKNLVGNMVRNGFDEQETRIRFYEATETLAAVVSDRKRRKDFEAYRSAAAGGAAKPAGESDPS